MIYTEKFEEIKEKCLRGSAEDIRNVISLLNDSVDLPTTRAVDFYLSLVTSEEGINEIEFELFHGTQIQRNYATLFFARRDDWSIVNRAFEAGLIDRLQAYSR